MLLVILVLVSSGALFLLWYCWVWSYWRRKGVPYLKPKFPFGNVKEAILHKRSFGELLGELYNRLSGEKFAGFYLFHKPALLLRDPEIIKCIITRDFDYFVDRNIHVTGKVNTLDLNLVNLRGEEWKKMRISLNPTFTTAKIKSMFGTIKILATDMSENLEKTIEGTNDVNISDIITSYVTDIIYTCAFGLETNIIKHPGAKIKVLGSRNKRSSSQLFMATYLPFLSKLLGFSFVDEKRANFIRKVVKETVEYREQKKIVRPDFLNLLIGLKNTGKVEDDILACKEDEYLRYGAGYRKNGQNNFVMTDDLLAAQCYVFYAAGQDTSITTLSFCLYELALNPDIHERAAHHVRQVLREHEGKLTYDALQDMKYLEYIVDETLRKYPAVPFLLRHCTKRYVIPGSDCIIEPGTSVYVPVYGIHYDSQYFHDPQAFNPNRFSGSPDSVKPYTYLPFGKGPRMCIGMRFSLIQIKVGLAVLLQHYTFKPCERTKIPMALSSSSGMMLTYADPIWLSIFRRNCLQV